MKEFKYHILLLVKRIFLILLFLTLSRFLFYVFNKSYFSDVKGYALFLDFIHGIRYDFSSVANLNSLFIVLSLAPVFVLCKKWYQSLLKILFIGVNSLILLVNFVDTKFFEFTKKRLTGDIFNSEWLGNDFLQLLPHFLADYWFLFVLFFIFIFFLIKLYPNYRPFQLKMDTMLPISIIKRWSIRFILLAIFIIGTRGGWQLKPINIISAAQYTSPKHISLVLNSSFTLIKTIDTPTISKKFFFNPSEVEKIYSPLQQFKAKKSTNKNLVIIILESFSKEYSGYLNNNKGYTPFLDSLMQKSLVFTQCYANGKSSIEALPSILSSLPSLMNEPFITSNYSGNYINSIALCLKEKNYKSAFFHGGKNGTMRFDTFTKLSSISEYYGLNEYPKESDYDGAWGIPDEPFLQYFAEKLDQSPSPFFASIFTLSSHHPYKIPEKWKNKFPKGKLINHESIGYADYSLKLFFEMVSKMKWFENTLFVLTADHTAQSEGGFYASEIGRLAIPLIFYSPNDTLLTGIADKTCSQTDIMPSVLDYLGYEKPFVAFGQSLFQDSVPHYSISLSDGIYQLIYDSIVITSDGNKIFSAKKIKGKQIDNLKITPNLPDYLKEIFIFKQAFIQQFNNRMIENKFSY